MADVTPETIEAVRRAATRLHHLSMRYSGALVELVHREPVGFLLKDHPGLSEARDLIDLVLLCRAEINGLTRCLCDAGVLDAERYSRQMAEEYEWLTREKAKFLGVEVTDAGIVIKPGGG